MSYINEYNYIGTQELENANRSLNNKMKQVADSCINKILPTFENDFKQKIVAIKKEILGSYQVVVYSTFQEVFYKHYGKHYDINSLNKSLNISIDNNLCPHLTYDITNFHLDSALIRDKRAFNQNARIEGSFKELMEFDEIDAVEEIEFWGEGIEETDPYDYAVEDITPPGGEKIFKKNTLITQPKEVYKEAEKLANEAFISQYEKIIKPDIYKKFGIRL